MNKFTISVTIGALLGLAIGFTVYNLLHTHDIRVVRDWGKQPYQVQVVSVSAPRQLSSFNVYSPGMESDTVRLAQLKLTAPNGKVSFDKVNFLPDTKKGTAMSLFYDKKSGLLMRPVDRNFYGMGQNIAIATIAGLVVTAVVGGILLLVLEVMDSPPARRPRRCAHY